MKTNILETDGFSLDCSVVCSFLNAQPKVVFVPVKIQHDCIKMEVYIFIYKVLKYHSV